MNVKKQNQKNCPDQDKCAKFQTKGFFAASKIIKYILVIFLILTVAQKVQAQSPYGLMNQANKLYSQEKFNEAIKIYDQVLIEKPDVKEPKFNKANSLYRMDDLGSAIDLYREVAAESKDMKLVTRAKYNLGNTYFQQGLKQRDSDLHKALEDLQTSIEHWRDVLEIEPENEKAARNIEVARLIIKDILDQINKQKQEQEDQQQKQDQQQQQQDQQQQGQQQQQSQQKQDQQQQDQQQQDTQEQDQQEQKQDGQSDEDQQKQQEQEVVVPDATAQEILDKEQRQKKERQILQSLGWQKVEKDW